MNAPLRIGLLGARGFVGAELLKLVARHPCLELGFVSSREWAGQPLSAQLPEVDLRGRFENLDPKAAAGAGVDIVVLAMPNGAAAPFVAEIDAKAPGTLVVDLSADYRFDDGWYYGLPELTRGRYAGQRRISNPGCYATAMQLLVGPWVGELDGPVQCFGVSGYSGAGTTPSDKNNPDTLRDNLIPYTLVNHIHEREVSRQLGHPVEFMPHVAPHFRGLTITANLRLREVVDLDTVRARYASRYVDEPLIALQDGAPWVSRIAGRHGVQIGGWTLSADGRRLVVVATLDNLLKGAATQAVQNINLAAGWAETEGILNG
ncbi:N-acetyl-gamma-glutamyl-phosphate reductase [Pseudomarimonas salicorniae]|uniref:N-acetyl-gamma-glutamyl-phosphate reductase n=1 Tax=Pseudomarimonas salicorniae TaxID=2933270 RepID=A0ABT0GIT9_9GAMM|nr:N-acetyl-gamma-glutamyl-phosphate reductase [Lysobacter sp. CAU 1642]MCK7594119.1 N-acetyl-gamma-glutamyl-phosphate reductase [Lysobacter sp. CAU 1642]